jgi:two-component system nitrogen regulation response regulator GlnG
VQVTFDDEAIHSTVWEEPQDRRSARLQEPRQVVALTLLCHPDLRRVGERAILRELSDGRPAPISRLQPELSPAWEGRGRPLADRRMSRSPLWISPGDSANPGGVRLDARDCPIPVLAGGLPIQGVQAVSEEELARGVVLELSSRSVAVLHRLTPALQRPMDSLGMVGHSDAVATLRQRIGQVADLDLPVLLRGETGTGKELAARAIHLASRRRGGPFVSVNMGAVPSSLAVSELFGATKGSFTGSTRDQPGYFQRAHEGSLFLDEIGETPAEVQPILLRALESGEIQRVGSTAPLKVDVRLIAATDADLENAVEQGRFRAPLLHRLAGYEIVVPPLRERRDDFGRLLVHFLRVELRSVAQEEILFLPRDGDEPWLPAPVVARLARHPWPGNLRQLRNIARELAVGSRGFQTAQLGPQAERLLQEVDGTATPPHGTPVVVRPAPAHEPPAKARSEPAGYRSPAEVSPEELLAALRANRWEIKPTALQLGVSRPSLYLMIEKLPGLRKASELSRAEILEARDACGGSLEAMVEQLEVSKPALLQRMKRLGLV